MVKILQSTEDPTLYHNGTILDKKGYTIALFGTIDTSREFETNEEIKGVTDIISVPVNIVEV